MRTLVHLPDLHFGRIDRCGRRAVADAILGARPDLIAIVGRLHAAGEGLRVQKAHDVPRFAAAAEAAGARQSRRAALERGRAIPHAADAISSLYHRGALARARRRGDDRVGVNTARSLTWGEGRISAAGRAHCRAAEGSAAIADRDPWRCTTLSRLAGPVKWRPPGTFAVCRPAVTRISTGSMDATGRSRHSPSPLE